MKRKGKVNDLPPTASRRRMTLLAPAVLAVACLAAYANSFHGPFVFDDWASIPENPTIRNLGDLGTVLHPPPGGTPVANRPLLNLSLAVNYALGGTGTTGYHVANLVIHILAVWTLFAIVRRTLLLPKWRGRFDRHAAALALAISALWALHPFQTESVTYIVQRAESLGALLILLTIYCFLRGAASGSRAWYGASVAICALGMACKETLAVAPLLVIVYDRVFLKPSWREVVRSNWLVHACLLATWAVLLKLVLDSPNRGGVGGFSVDNPIHYALTQSVVITHYLLQSVWPSQLCLDYGPWDPPAWQMGLCAAVIAMLIGATIWGFRRQPGLAFCSAWMFLLLAPTSSFYPLMDVAVQHRMYLPLAGLCALAVLGGYLLAQRLAKQSSGRGLKLASLAAIAVVCVWGYLTWQRNGVYQDELVLWQDVLAKRPENPRAYSNIGVQLSKAGRHQESIGYYLKSIEMRPNDPDALRNLANTYLDVSRPDLAKEYFEKALSYKEDPQARRGLAEALCQVAVAQAASGEIEAAIQSYRQCLRVAPDHLLAKNNLAWIWATSSRPEHRDPAKALELASQLDRQTGHSDPAMLDTLAAAQAANGQFAQAVSTTQEALRLAREQNQPQLVQELESRLKLYQAGKAYVGRQ